MCWALMPETAIDENDNLCSREDEIAGTAKRGERSYIHPIAKAECVYKPSDRELRLGVHALVRPH